MLLTVVALPASVAADEMAAMAEDADDDGATAVAGAVGNSTGFTSLGEFA